MKLYVPRLVLLALGDIQMVTLSRGLRCFNCKNKFFSCPFFVVPLVVNIYITNKYISIIEFWVWRISSPFAQSVALDLSL